MSKNKTHILLYKTDQYLIMYCGKRVHKSKEVNTIIRVQLPHIKNKKVICFNCLKRIYGISYANGIRRGL